MSGFAQADTDRDAYEELLEEKRITRHEIGLGIETYADAIPLE